MKLLGVLLLSPPFGGAAVSAGADLDDALWGLLEGNATLASLFGRPGWLWLEEGPPGDVLPHAVLVDPDADVNDLNTTDDYIDQQDRQVNVFATTKAEARTLGKAIKAALDPATGWTPLMFDDGTEFGRWPTRPAICEVDPDPGPDGGDVWCYRLFYTFLVSKVLGE